MCILNLLTRINGNDYCFISTFVSVLTCSSDSNLSSNDWWLHMEKADSQSGFCSFVESCCAIHSMCWVMALSYSKVPHIESIHVAKEMVSIATKRFDFLYWMPSPMPSDSHMCSIITYSYLSPDSLQLCICTDILAIYLTHRRGD